MFLHFYKKHSLKSKTITIMVCSLIISAIFLSGCRFCDIVKKGSLEEISEAIKNGADVNEKSGSGETPLNCAILYNKKPFESSLILVESGADVNMANDNGYIPLVYAIRLTKNDDALRLMKILISHGAKINTHCGYDGITPFMAASTRTDGIYIARLLLENGADVNESDVKRETALHYAVSVRGNGEIIELLLKNGADVNAGAPFFTPLHRAAYMGNSENIKILIIHGSSINLRGETSESKTPFETAVDAKKFEAARILAESGADINTETYYYYQPFKYRNNKQSYLDKMAHVDLDTIQFERMTPLHRAVTHNNLQFVEYLLSKGAKLNKDAHFGGYPLDFAIFLNYYDIAEILIRHKAPSLFADIYLMDAIEARDIKKTGLLLGIGASIKQKDYKEDTPLHLASKTGDIEILKLLLKHGADKSAKNREGKTPSEIAANEDAKIILNAK